MDNKDRGIILQTLIILAKFAKFFILLFRRKIHGIQEELTLGYELSGLLHEYSTLNMGYLSLISAAFSAPPH